MPARPPETLYFSRQQIIALVLISGLGVVLLAYGWTPVTAVAAILGVAVVGATRFVGVHSDEPARSTVRPVLRRTLLTGAALGAAGSTGSVLRARVQPSVAVSGRDGCSITDYADHVVDRPDRTDAATWDWTPALRAALNAPPVLPVTAAVVLSTVADGVVVVVGAGTTKRVQLSRSVEAPAAVKGNLLLLVLNKVARKGPDAYTYYQEGIPGRPLSPAQMAGRRRRTSTRSPPGTGWTLSSGRKPSDHRGHRSENLLRHQFEELIGTSVRVDDVRVLGRQGSDRPSSGGNRSDQRPDAIPTLCRRCIRGDDLTETDAPHEVGEVE